MGVLDQYQTTSHANILGTPYGDNIYAQTFKAGVSGELVSVHLWVRKLLSPNNLIIEVEGVSAGLPDNNVLASEEIDASVVSTDGAGAELTITFSSPATLTSGTDYAIVMRQKDYGGDSSNRYSIYGDQGNNYYTNGGAYFSANRGTNWFSSGSGYDYWFETYMTAVLEVLVEETISLSDETTPKASQESVVIEETLNLSDEITPKPSVEFVTIEETINLSDSLSGIYKAEYASRILYYNPLIIVCYTNPAKIVKVDISGDTPSWETYIINALGEDFANATDVFINETFDYIYVSGANGKVLKINANDFSDRSIIDLNDTDDLTNITAVEDALRTFVATENAVAELYEIDEMTVTTVNNKFSYGKLLKKVIDNIFHYIKGALINNKFNYLKIQQALLNNKFCYLTEEYDNLEALGQENFVVKIDGVQLEDEDVDLSSIIIRKTADEGHFASFKLTRYHDKLNYTINGTYSQITNKNVVTIYFNNRLQFTGTIDELNCKGSEESVTVSAKTKTWNKAINTVNLPLALNSERRHIYHLILDDIKIYNPSVSEDDEIPEIHKGIMINLGVSEVELCTQIGVIGFQGLDLIQTFNVVEGYNQSTKTMLETLYDGDIQGYIQYISNATHITSANFEYFKPKENWTYFYFVSGLDLINNRTFKYVYIGTSLSALSGEVYEITDVWAYRQRVWGNRRTELGYHYIGSAPYKERSRYDAVDYAEAVAQAEYDKMTNINGNILPQTSANINLTIDGFLYYNIDLLTRVNIINTTEANIYKNSNGFPLSVKGIEIVAQDMKVSLELDNAKSRYELDAIDDSLPDEPERSSGFAVDFRRAKKFNLPRWEDVE